MKNEMTSIQMLFNLKYDNLNLKYMHNGTNNNMPKKRDIYIQVTRKRRVILTP